MNKYKKEIRLLVIVFIGIGLCFFSLGVGYAEQSETITTYFPAPFLTAYDLTAGNFTVSRLMNIPATGVLFVGNDFSDYILKISDTDLKFLSNSYIDTTDAYRCDSGVCGGVFKAGNLEGKKFGVNPPYIELSGIKLLRMPTLVSASSSSLGPLMLARFVSNQIFFDAYGDRQDLCFTPGTCDALRAEANSRIDLVTEPCGASSIFTCSQAEGFTSYRKIGEQVFGIGAGVGIGGTSFGVGGAILMGMGGSIILPDYRRFQYQRAAE